MQTRREEILRLMLIAERAAKKLALDEAYPDVGWGLSPMVAEAEATVEIDELIAERLKED